MEESDREKFVILVVDDEPVIRTLNTEMLQMYGYKTLEASSGNKAFEVINNEKVPKISKIIKDIRSENNNRPIETSIDVQDVFDVTPYHKKDKVNTNIN